MPHLSPAEQQAIPALAIFIATYFFLTGLRVPRLGLDRTGAALSGAVAMVVFGVVGADQVALQAINWDTILLLLGMMILSSALARAGVFKWVSHAALKRAHGARGLLALLVLVAGGLSALMVNDTVCLMCTPLVVALIDDAKLPPWPFLLGLAFASNAGSVATPTGNPQNMVIATLSGIPFAGFTAALILPALVALAIVFFILEFEFRAELRAIRIAVHVEAPKVDLQAAIVCGTILVLVVVGFLSGKSLAWTAMGGAALALMLTPGPAKRTLAGVDGTLLLFFAALFVVTFGISQAGIAERLYDALQPLFGTTPGQQVVRFGAFAIGGSQLVSNVPFVLLASRWVPRMADPHLSWLALALTTTLAGNLTPVASVANLIVLELAGEKGRIPFLRFLRVGASCTFLPLAAGMATLWAERSFGFVK